MPLAGKPGFGEYSTCHRGRGARGLVHLIPTSPALIVYAGFPLDQKITPFSSSITTFPSSPMSKVALGWP